MAKETAMRRMVYIAAGLAIGVAALWAIVFVPRLSVHPQAIADGVHRSSKIFFAIQLIAVAALLGFIIPSRLGGRKIRELLYLAGILVFLQDFMVFIGAVYYLQTYQGFYNVAILMLGCVGANLIAGILAIIAGIKSQHGSSAR